MIYKLCIFKTFDADDSTAGDDDSNILLQYDV